MLTRERLDVVVICTPARLHGLQAIQVMRAGRHVLVKEPMASDREVLAEMLRVQQEAGTQLAVISPHRFDPGIQEVRRLIAAKALGRLVLAQAIIPCWSPQSDYEGGAGRGTAVQDGDVLLSQAVPSVDLLQWLMGPTHSVYAYATALVHRVATADVAVAVLHFASGALGSLAATTGAYPGLAARVVISGDQGSVLIENDQLKSVWLARNERELIPPAGLGVTQGSTPPADTPAPPNLARPPTHATEAQITDLCRAIREGGTPVVDGQAGRQPVELILALQESAQTHREIVLP
jgi:predicted dehydrogenase